jgi:hypothetical protein
MDQLTAQLQNLNKSQQSPNEDKEKEEDKACDELPAPQQSFQQCHHLTGRVGKMQGLKNTGPSN